MVVSLKGKKKPISAYPYLPLFLVGSLSLYVFRCPSAPIDTPCKFIFIDGGANVGDNLDRFSNEEVGGELPFWNETWDRKEFCVFAFEGNPRFTELLKEKEKALQTKFKKAEIFTETVLSDSEGDLEFFLDEVNPGKNYWASSISKRAPAVVNSNLKSVSVQSVDLVNFIGKFPEATTLILKLDIEGAEYGVLSKLVATGTLCRKNMKTFLAVEFHFYDIVPEEWKDFGQSHHARIYVTKMLTKYCNVELSSFSR